MSNKRYPSTILATACVPWNEQYIFQKDIFCMKVKKLIKNGVNHIYLFGTAGEGYAVTRENFKKIVEVFADEMEAPSLYPMVGLINLSMQEMHERIKIAYNYGIRDFQFALPSWGTLSDKEVFSFFHNMCDSYPDCRFFHYNLMRSGRLIDISIYEKLAEEIPNLVGAKFTSRNIDIIHGFVTSDCPIQFFLGEIAYAYGRMFGECGFLISLASSNLEMAWRYFNAGAEGDIETTIKLDKELAAIRDYFIRIAGPGKIDGAYDKVFSKLLIPSFPLRLLPPYFTVEDQVFEDYKKFLELNYPKWILG
jgi:dihydrodipicolinate synthase/N-acetylneuraminate lyase